MRNKKSQQQQEAQQPKEQKKPKKYDVQVGEDFALTEVAKPSILSHWQGLLVVAVFSLIVLAGAHAIITGDTYIFTKLMDTLREVAAIKTKVT